MPKIAYISKRFHASSQAIILAANHIIEEYNRAGYSLTLRQLYYQFVARDLIPNTQQDYKRLGKIINDARLAGLIDWYAIEDRTRNLKGIGHWNSPFDIIHNAASGYRIDKWQDQKYRAEVWIEKEALAGVFERVCYELDVPYLSCRGYTSQSEMWAAAQRLIEYQDDGQIPVILYFGDHDPSGIDMTRDIVERLHLFDVDALLLRRLALNMDQVEEYQPPPNPAKTTDSRYRSYIRKYGRDSWELDALEPKLLASLVETEVNSFIDEDLWFRLVERERIERDQLNKVADDWDNVVDFIEMIEGENDD